MTAAMRAATLTHFEQVAIECGLDPRRLVAEVGLPEQCLREPDLIVPAHLVCALLDLAARRAREPSFGLRMAAMRRLSNLGPLGLLVRDQPTLRRALEVVLNHIHVHNESFSLMLVQDGPWVRVREEMLLEGGHPVHQAIEMAMGTTFPLLRFFLGDGWQPHQVSFRHGAPKSTAWHRKVFGSRVVFGQEFNDIYCNARDLDAPNPGADPIMARYSQRLLEGDHGPHASMTERVRRLIVLLLPRGHCRAEVVAQHLGVDRRTVTNHLTAEGTGFKALVNAMRRDLLTRYLRDGTRPLSEVAPLLGFSELSAFSRWHRQHLGSVASKRRSRKLR